MTLLFICIGAVALFAIILWAVLASGPAGAKNPDGSFPNQSAQTGTNATPPVGGVAAGQQRDSPTRGATREARQTNGWDILWRLFKFGLILLVIWFGWRAWQSDGFQKRWNTQVMISNAPTLEDRTTYLRGMDTTWFSANNIVPDDVPEYRGQRIPSDARILRLGMKGEAINEYDYVLRDFSARESQIGDTLNFRCLNWSYRNEAFYPMQGGDFVWIVGKPFNFRAVLKGTRALLIYGISHSTPIEIGVTARRR